MSVCKLIMKESTLAAFELGLLVQVESAKVRMFAPETPFHKILV